MIPGISFTFNSYLASMPSFSNKMHFFSRTLLVSNAATGGVITKIDLLSFNAREIVCTFSISRERLLCSFTPKTWFSLFPVSDLVPREVLMLRPQLHHLVPV